MIDLKKKVGPLPVWAYGAIAGGGALILFLRARKKTGAAGTAADATAPAADGYSGPYTGSDSTLGGPGSSSYGTSTAPNPQAPIQGAGTSATAAAAAAAHAAHLQHLAHVAATTKKPAAAKPTLTAAQLHTLHLQHLATLRK